MEVRQGYIGCCRGIQGIQGLLWIEARNKKRLLLVYDGNSGTDFKVRQENCALGGSCVEVSQK